MQIINLFPLTIVKEKILIQENEREKLVNEIKKMKQQDNEQQQRPKRLLVFLEEGCIHHQIALSKTEPH